MRLMGSLEAKYSSIDLPRHWHAHRLPMTHLPCRHQKIRLPFQHSRPMPSPALAVVAVAPWVGHQVLLVVVLRAPPLRGRHDLCRDRL